MKPILCFGEALVDCLKTGELRDDGLVLPEFRHYPGGAPANVAVAAAKLGADAHFAGQVGNDVFGRFLQESLARYGVKLENLSIHQNAPTPMAFVLLDSDGERSFEFLRSGTADLFYRQEQLNWQDFSEPGIFHICSNTLTDEPLRGVTLGLVNQAREKGWRTSFDVNLRTNLWPRVAEAGGAIDALACQVDLIKASLEELHELWPDADVTALVQRWMSKGVRAVVVTNGGESVSLYTASSSTVVNVPKVKVVDTTAAGDAFVGGLLYHLAGQSDWSDAVLEEAVNLAVRCGAFTVERAGAYPALPWAKDLL